MFAVIDFETTNRVADRRATEVAIAVLNSDLEVVTKYESIVNPQTMVYRDSLGYSRLTQREIDSAPTFAQLWPAIAPLLSGNLLVMHNSDFDRGVLANEFEAMGMDDMLPPAVCTYKNAKRIISGRPKSGGYTLENLAFAIGLPASDAHQAMVDVDMTTGLFRHLHVADAELRRTCTILLEEVADYRATGKAARATPRVRYRAGGKSDADLQSIVAEIGSNDKVLDLSEVCRTGTLEDQEAVEVRLNEIGFALQEAEPRKSTAFLIQGSKAGKRKVDKALSFGRPVLTESEALAVIGMLKLARRV
jgi:DNA polymerase-3 subunit epsilon